MKITDKQTEKPNLLDLFIISNVPSSTTFHLFCRFLDQDDVYEYEYFEESQVEKYDLPHSYQLDKGYFEKTYLHYREISGGCLVEGFLFGTYNSYEEAVCAAQAYTAESLLEKYFAVYEEAKYKSVDESIW